jgi:hypothetical protein
MRSPRRNAKSQGTYRSYYPGASGLMTTTRDSLKRVVRPERFELPTLWFEARCSIQLSYGRNVGLRNEFTKMGRGAQRQVAGLNGSCD